MQGLIIQLYRRIYDNKNPCENAGIKLELGNNRWLGLIKESASII